MALFTDEDLEKLSGPHVQRVWCAELVLPSGTRYLHTGSGRLVLGGQTWEGVSDPFGGQLVALSGMEEPRFGKAIAVDALFSGANRAFLKSVWDSRHAIEGAPCSLFFATFDPETGEVLIPLKKVLPGKISSVRMSFAGSSIRAIAFKVVSIWEGLNFHVTGSMWSPAGQRKRYPGNRSLDWINSEIIEVYKR